MSKIEGVGRYLEPWKDAIFGGRARRREYWTFALVNLVVVFLDVSSLADPSPLEQDNSALTALIAICGLAALAAFVTTGIRRMHDSGHSGWWFLCPLVNVYLTLIDGDPGVNRFGTDPKWRDPQATRSPSAIGLMSRLAFVLAVIALPFFARPRWAVSPEASAIGVLRAIHTEQSNFFQLCNGYSPDLPTLGANNYLSVELTRAVTVRRLGYRFTVRKSSAPGTELVAGRIRQCDGSVTRYYASAIPLKVDTAGYGHRSFATNEQGTIYQDVTGAAIADPPVAGGNVSEIQ